MDRVSNLPPSRLIGSANSGYAAVAIAELRQLFPDLRTQLLEPQEVFQFQTQTPLSRVYQVLRQQEPIFLRHVQPIEQEVEIQRTEKDCAIAPKLLSQETRWQPGEKVATQVRRVKGVEFAYTAYGMKAAIDELLIQRFGLVPVVRQADWVISLYLTSDRLYLGLSQPAHNLSDWSGGIIRFQKELGLVSRAKFKLLEAETRFQLDLHQFHQALDVGAAPGGWTSLLLEREVAVTAIDPANLHPALKGHPHLTHLAQKAERVTLPRATYDLLVCDMNWSPYQTAQTIRRLLPALRAESIVILTVKLLHKKPLPTVQEVLAILANELQLLHAKQLFHNRDEVTLILRKP
jgi:23S rRNA (cytidine2498-2'-O)-methyltransferase